MSEETTYTPRALGGLIVKKYTPPKEYFVYFLMMNKSLMYIGKTSDIRKRLQAHASNTCLFDEVFYLECSAGDVSRIEEAMISLYNPPLNKAGVCTTPQQREVARIRLSNPNKFLLEALGIAGEN